MKRYGHAVFAIASALLAGAAQADEPSANATWYSILTDGGTLVGHATHDVVPTDDGTEIVDTQEIDVNDESGGSTVLSPTPVDRSVNLSWRTVEREDKAGRTLSIDSVSRRGPEQQHTTARIAEGYAEITRQTEAETRNFRVALPADVRFDSGDALLAGWNPATVPRLEFQNFNMGAMAVERVTIEPIGDGTPDAQGRIAVLRKGYEGSEMRAITRLLLDSSGRIVEVTQPMFGSSLTIRLSDKNTALYSRFALHALTNEMTKSPFRISQEALAGHIRYRFSFHDGAEFSIPQTGEQRVTTEPGAVTVDICADCGPGLAGDEADLASALKPTAWLQSDDPRIRAITDPVAKLPVSDTRKMELLLQKAKPYLGRVDFTGHYSALETMARHAADCTDAAALLAAFGRAAGIPTRVASGMVYSQPSYHGVSNVFMPHSWTLAFVDGKWKSFDLALDDFDATHIALTIGDGDERSVLAAGQLAGLLHWDNMAEVRTQAAN